MANFINGNLIDLLISSAETMRSEIYRALEQYRKEREVKYNISRRFKDDDEYFAEEQNKLAEYAREAIEKAERIFRNKTEDYSAEMEKQLRKHLHQPVNEEFQSKLKMIADFGIQPERLEIEDLLSLNQGNQTGLQALSATLKKVNSPFVLTFHTTADYQKDISEIRNIMLNMKYIPREFIVEGAEIYRGIPYDFTYPNGNVLHGAGTYNGTNLSENGNVSEGMRIAKELGERNARNAETYSKVMAGMAK